MLHTNGVGCQFKFTGDMADNHLAVYEMTLPPKTVGARLHFDKFTDEILVLKGILTVQSSDKVYDAEEGTVVQVPRLFTPKKNGETS